MMVQDVFLNFCMDDKMCTLNIKTSKMISTKSFPVTDKKDKTIKVQSTKVNI